jgi:predicted amidohydrolase
MAGKEINDDLKALDKTLEVASEIGVPVAVHATDPAESMASIARRLRKDDVLVHFLHGTGNTIIEPDGKVGDELWKARERGVWMDASNGSRHFSFAVAKSALAQKFAPDIISSDVTGITLHAEPVLSLPHLMSKYLNMGMSLMDVVRCVTTTPARLCRMEGRLGTLKTGSYADVAVLKIVECGVIFRETSKPDSPSMKGTKYMLPRLTVIKGVPAFRSPEMASHD